ncbi:MAG: N-acetylglutaminylglutamine amidotransferase [Gammaproteobacteria bacterium]
MCGIAGELRFDGRAADADAVGRMMCPMQRRGPDGFGLFQQGTRAFGHQRLKIMDLTERAQQPMFDAALGLGIVYNGAIYNHHELRKELEVHGYTFFSTGDTEVILKAWHHWGDGCVDHFHGMFAFALWERDTGRTHLVRDRLGIKPLYYAERAGIMRIASTLPALLAAGDVDTSIDPVALHHYLSFHSVVPAPHTILNGVRKLPPATLMTIEPDGARRSREYWRADYHARDDERGLSFEDWQDRVLGALRTAVERRLVADVPVGVLLSGGLDSSLIVGLLAEAGQHGLGTYSIGFESVGGECGDEFKYSDVIARHFDTDHHQIRIDTARMLPALADCIDAMAEPMVSHDAVGFFLLSQEVARTLKVVQSGQGADEVFGGYHWYPPLLDSRDALADYRRVFFDRDHAEFSRIVDPALVGKDHSSAFVAAHFNRAGATHPVDQAMRLDTNVMLVDDPVKRVDNMTMAWGLEARVPFLDHELVELAARVPAEYKVGSGGKYVLKEAARRVIPTEVIDRPKGYFPVPALKHLEGAYLDMVRSALQSPAAQQRGLFQRAYVDELLSAPNAQLTPLRGSKLWQLALLELWLQRHVDTAIAGAHAATYAQGAAQ